VEHTLDTLDQLSLASECLLASVGRPEIRPVVLNLFSSETLLDRWVADHYYNLMNGLPEPENVVEPIVAVNLTMSLTRKMFKVRDAAEYEFLCDIGLDLLDVYRSISGHHDTEIAAGAHVFVVGTRDHFIGITASLMLSTKMNQLTATLPPIEHQNALVALSESLIAQQIMDSLKDGRYFSEKMYEYVLKYQDKRMTLEPVEAEDTAPIVLPEQDEEWPEMISAHEN
jgi:hypothetical protein